MKPAVLAGCRGNGGSGYGSKYNVLLLGEFRVQ